MERRIEHENDAKRQDDLEDDQLGEYCGGLTEKNAGRVEAGESKPVASPVGLFQG